MENTEDRRSSRVETLTERFDYLNEPLEERVGARMENGFNTLLACENDSKPPAALIFPRSANTFDVAFMEA